MQKVWQIKHPRSEDFITELLHERGIRTEEQVKEFLNPTYSNLHDPFLFTEMNIAVDRIWKAVQNKEKILIFSDYDADAITAISVLYRLFKFLGVEAETYIPDRFTEGYGLNLAAFEKIREMGVTLVLTVDCGTNSTEEANFCKANGIDLIITDHHEITGDTPDAFALINPKNPQETYPYHELTGVGVAFKVACGVLSRKENHQLPDGFEKWLLDYVAIGTVADIHSLVGENRILVKYGLQVLAKTKWIGLRELIKLAGLDLSDPSKAGDTYPLGFVIAPRINAAGRIDHAGLAFRLLATDDGVEAQKLARELETLNTRRQQITEVVMSEAREQLIHIQNNKVLLATAKDWPKGVVGLVAGKLTEEFQKPVIVLEKGETQSTGSARSTKDLNIVDALKDASEFLVRFGGHAAAAGMTLNNENVDVFYRRILDFADKEMPAEHIKVVEIDTELLPADVNIKNYETLDKFQPFGVDNPKPRFALMGLVLEQFQTVGKTSQHLQVTFSTEGNSGKMILKGIGFGFGPSSGQLVAGGRYDVAFEMIADSWQGKKNIKLRLIDMRKAE
jgi:single-stranded-DNA-specific exonuclease